MRHRLPILAAVSMLAACGSNGGNGSSGNAAPVAGPATFDRPDGSFDRARYRVAALRTCSIGMQSENSAIPAAEVNRMCTCLIDRQIAASSDEVLRATLRDPAESRRTLNEAAGQCGLPLPTDADMGIANGAAPPAGEDEPPPPEEPVPSLNDAMPPPIVQEPPQR
jgi:hypothetical protein